MKIVPKQFEAILSIDINRLQYSSHPSTNHHHSCNLIYVQAQKQKQFYEPEKEAPHVWLSRNPFQKVKDWNCSPLTLSLIWHPKRSSREFLWLSFDEYFTIVPALEDIFGYRIEANIVSAREIR
ncbi:hypothetical protein HNY73_000179 [Argiope bruennichi]|uniref:Uncharacterized protein n=1 Tax=Argiope bruennichi TaxID=94029 RepID=A0A8T0FY85_ARGBR|nr:hypothetical protein HNY73_000179 [Argiope bruennichi]